MPTPSRPDHIPCLGLLAKSAMAAPPMPLLPTGCCRQMRWRRVREGGWGTHRLAGAVVNGTAAAAAAAAVAAALPRLLLLLLLRCQGCCCCCCCCCCGGAAQTAAAAAAQLSTAQSVRPFSTLLGVPVPMLIIPARHRARNICLLLLHQALGVCVCGDGLAWGTVCALVHCMPLPSGYHAPLPHHPFRCTSRSNTPMSPYCARARRGGCVQRAARPEDRVHTCQHANLAWRQTGRAPPGSAGMHACTLQACTPAHARAGAPLTQCSSQFNAKW